MSDTPRPEGPDTQNQTFEIEKNIPHSGKLPGDMAERPLEDFDKTRLEEAHERNLISPLPEHPGDLPEANRLAQQSEVEARTSRNKLALFIGGGLFTLAAVGAGFLMGQGKDTVEATDITPSTQPFIEDDEVELAPQETTDTTAPVEIEEPLGNMEFGNLVLADAYKPGEEFVAATRPNGEVLQIPKLRSLDDPQAFGESALALMACYLSTGNEDCLIEFSENPDIQANLTAMREGSLLHVIEPLEGYPTLDNFQLVFYDTPEDPATFRYNPNTNFFTLDSGSIRMQLSDDEKWQGIESTDAWYGRAVTGINMRVEEDPGQRPLITSLDIGFGPVE